VAALLKNSGINKEQEEYLSIIDACSQNLLNLANDFLDFTKLEVGKMVSTKKPALTLFEHQTSN